jgi:hypothetical protein
MTLRAAVEEVMMSPLGPLPSSAGEHALIASVCAS